MIVAVAVLTAFTVGASAAAGEGPPCADVTAASVNFPASGTGIYTLRVEAELKAPACIGKVTYKLFVTTDAGTAEATFLGYSAEGSPRFEFSSSDNTICFYLETSLTKTGRVYDRAPDAGATPDCVELLAGAAGGRVGVG